MAILEIQGLDNYGVGDAFTEQFSPVVGSTVTFNETAGKRGGTAMQVNGLLLFVNHPMDAQGDEGSIAANCMFPTVTDRTLFRVHRNTSTTNTSSSLGIVYLKADGSITVAGDSEIEHVIFPEGTIVANEYYYICFSFIMSNTGTLTVRVNNATASHIGPDTFNYTTAYLSFGGDDTWYDDIVVDNTADYYQNPPRVIEHIVPDSDRAAQDFAPLGAGAGYVEVDDLIPDNDTSYISASTVGDISEFGLSNLPADVTEVHAAKVVTYGAREGTGGTNGVDTSFHTSVGTQLGTVNQPLTDGVYTIGESAVVDLTAYTIADVNGFYVKNEVV